jgi:peptide/nickel transport system permease protein
MARFLISRLLGGLLTLVVSAAIVFAIVRLIPGDPVSIILGREYEPEVAASLRELYGFDEPIHTQFVSWVGGIMSGDFGHSMLSQVPVTEELAVRIPRTLYLMVGGVLTALLIALPAGMVAARRPGRALDIGVTSGTTLMMSIPQFYLGILLSLVVSVQLGLLPAAGYVDPLTDPWGSLQRMILPWLTIGLTMSAFITRVLRSSLLDVLGQDYIRTARARGLSEASVMSRHALRNAAIPTVTVVGLEIGYLMGGAIVVETVFAYPGMGQLMIDSILQRDYPLVQASILFFATAFVVVNLLTDLLYALLDPRLRGAS